MAGVRAAEVGKPISLSKGVRVCWTLDGAVACDPSGAAAGRHLLADGLAGVLRPAEANERAKDDDLIADAGLVAAELLSNAVHACRTRVVVRLDVHHDHIRIGVFDDGPGKPELRKPAGNDPGGRGLAIVKALSTAWGTTPHASGKCVWSEMPVVTASSSHLNCTGGSVHPGRPHPHSG